MHYKPYQFSSVVQNTRKYEEIHRRTREECITNPISSVVQNTRKYEEIHRRTRGIEGLGHGYELN